MQSLAQEVVAQIEQVVLGKHQQVTLSLACVLAKGHLLIEDLPGMGKTTLAHVLAKALGLSYQRVQFTSDLLPSDVIGVSIFDQANSSFTFHKGPLFNQLVLADEINRSSPKTQSALLEAMEEGKVSVDGETHQLPNPFCVIATQNPLFHAGTYPLPESQLDRFLMRISLGFPDRNAEKQILLGASGDDLLAKVDTCLTPEQLLSMQKEVAQLHVSEAILDYVIALCQQSRASQEAINPLSPRAGKALVAAAKAWAYIRQGDFVTPDDVKAVFSPVCEHRLQGSKQLSEITKNASEDYYSSQLLANVDSTKPFSG